jgi:Cu(I)/Ag(I) efflux system membrane fusion protein
MKRLKYGLIAVILSFLTSSVWSGNLDRQVDQLLREYFKIHKSLAQDSTTGVDEAAGRIGEFASQIESGDAEVQKLVSDIRKASLALKGKSLDATRNVFFDLSQPLLVYLNKYHSHKDQYSRFYCSMVNKAWVQSDKEVANPYHGQSMLRCGELIE